MRGVDLPAKIRTIERILDLEIRHITVGVKCFLAFDWSLPSSPEGTVRGFEVHYRLDSQAEKALKQLHGDIYRARGEEVHRRQDKKCCFCGAEIRQFEIDHIESRGAHGRSDAMTNLRACCTGLGGCGLHRRRHGG